MYDPLRDPQSEACHEAEREAERCQDEYERGYLDEEYGRYCREHGGPLEDEFLRDYQEREAPECRTR